MILLSGQKKTTFSIFVKDTRSLNASGYADLALECLKNERLLKLQNKIVCFIGDGLRAQTAGLDPKSGESFQHRNGIGDFSKILFSPCFNHRIQNSFKKTYREMKLFRDIVKKINIVAIFLRKPAQVKILKRVCPEPIVTRWQYIFNICIFIEKNLEKIKSIIELQESHKYDIDFDLELFIKIIHPLRSATIVLSTNKCCLSDVYPIIMEVLQQYEKLKLECSEDKYVEIIDALIENIKYYTITSPQQSFLMLSYILTPQGRSDLYERDNKKKPENEETYITFQKKQLPDLLSNQSKENNNDEINIDSLIDIIEEEEKEQSDKDDFFSHHDDDEELEQTSEKRSTYEICRDSIEKLIKYLKINIFEQHNLYQRLREWINMPHNEIPFFELIDNCENSVVIWEEIIKTESDIYKKWKALADIALRLNAIAATETNCERTISLQGFIAKDRAQRAKPDLLNARLIHLQSKE